MSDTTDLKQLFKDHNALLEGHFQLSSGLHSSMYMQSALVLKHPHVAEMLGTMLADAVRGIMRAPIDCVVAPAMGGLIIGHEVARALNVPFIFTERVDGTMTLRRGFSLGHRMHVVIVEDVITTGKSTREVCDIVTEQGGIVCACAALVDRSGGNAYVPASKATLLTLEIPSYEPAACPLCKQNIPVEKPGSRFIK